MITENNISLFMPITPKFSQFKNMNGENFMNVFTWIKTKKSELKNCANRDSDNNLINWQTLMDTMLSSPKVSNFYFLNCTLTIIGSKLLVYKVNTT